MTELKLWSNQIEIIQEFQRLGYSKIVTTPHISEAYYPNKITELKRGHELVLNELSKRNISLDLALGAEYMIDGEFLKSLKSKEGVLSWNGYVLIETSFRMFPAHIR